MKVLKGEEIVSTEVGTEYWLDINNPTLQTSEALTFEEITEQISNDLEISIAEAQTLVVENSDSQSRKSAQVATYRTLSQQFTVTTSYNAGVDLGVGKSANISFGVSQSSNHYKYRYVEAYYNW